MDNRRNQTVNNNLKSRIKAAIIGFIVGDALGVPVEFTTREERKLRLDAVCNRVVLMNKLRVHGQMIQA